MTSAPAPPSHDALPDDGSAPLPPPETTDGQRPGGEPGEPPPAGAEAPVRPAYGLFAAVSTITTVLDLGSKAWASRTFEPESAPPHITVVPGFMNLTLSHNPGAAWGMLHDAPTRVRLPFFIGVSVLAVGVVVLMFRKARPEQRALRWGLPLVLGGALGNLVDRVRFSYVVDFIQVYARWGGQEHYWPTFNVADVAICIGVGLLMLDALTQGRAAASEAT